MKTLFTTATKTQTALTNIKDTSDLFAVYAQDKRPPHSDRPWVMLNMISSADGATAVQGVSEGLGGPGDKDVFSAIRSVADIILVGANTLRAESYRLPKANPKAQLERAKRQQAPRPRLAIITSSLQLDYSTEVFLDDPAPLLFTVEQPHSKNVSRAHEMAEVYCLPSNSKMGSSSVATVDIAAVIRHLKTLGADVVLAEGGPQLNGQLLATGMLDELCWTVAPLLTGGTSQRLIVGAPPVMHNLKLDRVLADDHFLFLRYLTDHGSVSATTRP